MAKKTRNRSAKTGQFVTDKYEKAHKSTTIKESVKKKAKKKAKK
jgi:hypothetical protein